MSGGVESGAVWFAPCWGVWLKARMAPLFWSGDLFRPQMPVSFVRFLSFHPTAQIWAVGFAAVHLPKSLPNAPRYEPTFAADSPKVTPILSQ